MVAKYGTSCFGLVKIQKSTSEWEEQKEIGEKGKGETSKTKIGEFT
jgi:hypothetical protein